jgi:7-cyano-7-deazaguanine synthase in queuosine biosynthesis
MPSSLPLPPSSAAAPGYRNRIAEHLVVPADRILANPHNPRRHPDEQTALVSESLQTFGWLDELKVIRHPTQPGYYVLMDGEDRMQIAAGQPVPVQVPVAVLDLTPDEANEALAVYDATTLLAVYDAERSALLADQLRSAQASGSASRAADLLRTAAEVNPAAALLEHLAQQQAERAAWLDQGRVPYEPMAWDDEDDADDPNSGTDEAQDAPGDGTEQEERHTGQLVAQFGVLPFTVLDTRQGYWQARKRAWIAACGIDSEIGREQIAGSNIRFGANSAMRRTLSTDERDFAAGDGNERPALSIFDPALCEVVYRWFSPPQAHVLDPFAGGSVRGIVAARTGRAYTGIELRDEQVAANEQQWQRLMGAPGAPGELGAFASDVVEDMVAEEMTTAITSATNDDGVALPSYQHASSPRPEIPGPDTLLGWMTRLYRLTLDEQHLEGDLGVWPIELRDYLELLCLAYSEEAARFTVATDLLLPRDTTKPVRADVCVLLFSGGKDSMAAGILAQQAGYRVHAVYVRTVNATYDAQEGANAHRIATLLGWDFDFVTPHEPLPRATQEALCKNQYCWALALDWLPFIPGGITSGALRTDDCDTTVWFHDFIVAFEAFRLAHEAVYGPVCRLLTLLQDSRQALEIWGTLPDEVRTLTTSCFVPARYKPQHQRRNRAIGVPLGDYDCGSCEKCYERAVILAYALGQRDQYPAEYLNRAVRRLREGMSKPLWCHAHPRLRTPYLSGAPRDAERYTLDHVFAGAMVVERQQNMAPAHLPIVRVLSDQGQSQNQNQHTNTVHWPDPLVLSPVEERLLPANGGTIWLKRDDLAFELGGVRGGKARAVWQLTQGATGIVTAGARSSTQIEMAAHIGRQMGVPVRVHVPQSKRDTPTLAAVREQGAEIIEHMPGHTSVVVRRAKDDAQARGWAYVPYALESRDYVDSVRPHVRNIPADARRLVVPVGCGMTLAGILWGLDDCGRGDLLILGVAVGADPTKRLDKYAPADWRDRVELVWAPSKYSEPATQSTWWGVRMDSYYEAKAAPFVESGDCLWLVGIHTWQLADAHADGEMAMVGRMAHAPTSERSTPVPQWICGDSRNLDSLITRPSRACADGDHADYDLLFTCPPYFDLERYSDDPRDLSNAPDYATFRHDYARILQTALAHLADDRFAVLMVGDVRAEQGAGPLLPFVADTIAACEAVAGVRLYNDAVVILPTGTLPIRAGRTFRLSRKLGRNHQRLLVFVKGDWRQAVAACGGETAVMDWLPMGDEVDGSDDGSDDGPLGLSAGE